MKLIAMRYLVQLTYWLLSIFFLKFYAVHRIYKNQHFATPAMRKHFKKSRSIKILTYRLRVLTDPTHQDNFVDELNAIRGTQVVRVLVGDTGGNHVKHRGFEYEKIDGQPRQQYLAEIDGCYEQLRDMAAKLRGLEPPRKHNSPVVFRLFLFEEVAFLGFYLSERAHKNTIFCVKKDTMLYESFERYFDQIWDPPQ